MPSVDWNLQAWDKNCDWSVAGDDWSAAWGGQLAQWVWTVYPRIAAYVPAGTVLEIAPGFGRWTQWFRGLCRQLILVDLSAQCIDACRERFRADTHITYHVNDGTSLGMVPAGAVDFVFSFDSLVHAELPVLQGYFAQLREKLTPNGVGFVHHSNLGAYARYLAAVERLPRGKYRLEKWGVVERNPYNRATTVTAAAVERAVTEAGMVCVGQELINWQSRRLNDCLTVFTLPGSRWARPNRVVHNRGFMAEAARAAESARQYHLTWAGAKSG